MRRALLVQVLGAPARVAGFDLPAWEILLREADSANMAATLLFLLEQEGLLDGVPPQPRDQLEAARTVALRHRRLTLYEVDRIRHALAGLGLPLVLLKGAAYSLAELEAGRGRMFSDIDILVPKMRLDQVESALMLHGWASTHHDGYDQRYYRQWMHELPPMIHLRRGNVVDVHHAILPETAKLRPDPAILLAAASPIVGKPGLYTLGAHDMFLHSAAHLFCNGEFDHGLRDLFDLHRLATQFGATTGFWEGLVPRAEQLQLMRPLYYALRYLHQIFETAIPPAVLYAAGVGQPALLLLMDALFMRALQPAHPRCNGRLDALARFGLYVRGNWLRMPPLMLTRHLLHKAFISPRTSQAV